MQQSFYDTVNAWIRSCRNQESLQYLRRFVDRSTQPRETKEQMHRDITLKAARLRAAPQFVKVGKAIYLADEKWNPREYRTRFGAVCKMAELALKGHDVELEQNETCYRIFLTEKNK